MLKSRKMVNLICSMLFGALFMLAVLAILMLTGVISTDQNVIRFKTESKEALYSGAPLTLNSYSISDGKLKKGHRVKVTYKGSQTAVGESENAIEVKIFDEMDTDVTSDYTIYYDFGTLKVNPRSIVVESGSSEKLYDGTALVNPNYTVSGGEDELIKGHDVKVSISGSITDVGFAHNTISAVAVYDRMGKDVSINYRITLKEGILYVYSDQQSTEDDGDEEEPQEPEEDIIEEWYDPLFAGDSNMLLTEEERQKVLYRIFAETDDTVYLKIKSYGDFSGKGWLEPYKYKALMDGKYSAAYLSGLALERSGGQKKELYIVPQNQPAAMPYYSLGFDSEIEKWTNDAQFDQVSDKIYYSKYLDYSSSVLGAQHPYSDFEEEYRKFVYTNYLKVDSYTKSYMTKIITSQGFDPQDPQIFEKVADYIKSAAVYNELYDVTLDEKENIATTFLEMYKEGVCLHFATAATLLFRTLGIPARYTVGVKADVSGGVWTNVKAERAHAWVEVYLDGTGWIIVDATGTKESDKEDDEVIEKKKLTLAPVSVSKKYDGTQIKAPHIISGFEELEKLGYVYDVKIEGGRTNPGIGVSRITDITIFDSYGNNATSEFDIVFVNGTIHVYSETLAFRSGSYTKEYDGITEIREELFEGELPAGYTYQLKALFRADVGIHINYFDVIILDGSGNDVSAYFKIYKEYGGVEITPKSLTLKAGDAEKKYDGSPLVCNEINVMDGELAEGQRILKYSVVGSQTSVGRSENIIESIIIIDENGNDVTSNYKIVLISGKLRVTE